MYLKNKYTSKVSLAFLSIVVFALLAIFEGLCAEPYNVPLYTLKRTTAQPSEPKTIVVGSLPTVKAKVTAFSSVECKTTWCRNHPERSGHQIALNASYGKASKVYIPAYDKEYDVIGTTDYKTDADIYMGSDQQSAKEHGVKYLDIKIIK